MLPKLFQSVVIDACDNGAEAELKLHLRDDSPRQVAVQEERAAPPPTMHVAPPGDCIAMPLATADMSVARMLFTIHR